MNLSVSRGGDLPHGKLPPEDRCHGQKFVASIGQTAQTPPYGFMHTRGNPGRTRCYRRSGAGTLVNQHFDQLDRKQWIAIGTLMDQLDGRSGQADLAQVFRNLFDGAL